MFDQSIVRIWRSQQWTYKSNSWLYWQRISLLNGCFSNARLWLAIIVLKHLKFNESLHSFPIIESKGSLYDIVVSKSIPRILNIPDGLMSAFVQNKFFGYYIFEPKSQKNSYTRSNISFIHKEKYCPCKTKWRVPQATQHGKHGPLRNARCFYSDIGFMGVYFIQKSLVFPPFKGFSVQDECVLPENMTYVIIKVG